MGTEDLTTNKSSENRQVPASIARARRALEDIVEGRRPAPQVFSEGSRYYVVLRPELAEPGARKSGSGA